MQSKADCAHVTDVGDLTICRRINVGINVRVLRRIKQVRDLRLELQRMLLSDDERFRNRGIASKRVRSSYCVPPRVAVLARTRRAKCIHIEKVINCRIR